MSSVEFTFLIFVKADHSWKFPLPSYDSRNLLQHALEVRNIISKLVWQVINDI